MPVFLAFNAIFAANLIFLFQAEGLGQRKTVVVLAIAAAYIAFDFCLVLIARGRPENLGRAAAFFRQALFISVYAAFFLYTGYIAVGESTGFTGRVCLLLNGIGLIVLGVLFCWRFSACRAVPRSPRMTLSRGDALSCLFLAAVTAAVRLPMMGTLQRWDAGEYYYALGNACRLFDFRPGNTLSNFSLCHHTTLGFSFLYAPGEFLNPRGTVGVLLINLALTVAGCCALYLLLRKLYPKTAPGFMLFTATVFTLTPFFLGSFGYLTPDYLVPVAFVLALWHEYRKEHLLQLFWLLIVVHTKEPSVLVVLGYFAMKLLFRLCRVRPLRRAAGSAARDLSLWAGLASGLSFALILWGQNGVRWHGGRADSNVMSVSNSGINCLGFNPSYILFRVKQHFILDFAWIFTALLILALAIWLSRRLRRYKNQHMSEGADFAQAEFLASVFAALFFAFLTNTFYITAGAYRYCTVFVALYPVAVLLVCRNMLLHLPKPAKGVLSAVLIGLLAVETAIHIDPLSRVVFDTASTGNWYTVLTNKEHTNFGNDLCNNYQYTWVDRSLDRMLQQIGFDGSQILLIAGEQQQGLQVKGNGDYYKVCWDSEDQKRVIFDETTLEEDPALKTITTMHVSQLEDQESLPEEAVVFFVPYYNTNVESELEKVKPYYAIGDEETASSLGGEITYYQLKKL